MPTLQICALVKKKLHFDRISNKRIKEAKQDIIDRLDGLDYQIGHKITIVKSKSNKSRLNSNMENIDGWKKR